MIWDWLVSYGTKHPVIMRGIVGTVTTAIFGYIALALITSSIIEGNRDTCERGNAIRLADKAEAISLAAAVTLEKGQAQTKIGKEAKQQRIEAYEQKQEALIAIAVSSGHENGEGSVTINCLAEWPKPLPLLGD